MVLASLAIAMVVSLGATAGPANSFNIPRTSTQSASTMRKQWGSMGHLVDKGSAEVKISIMVTTSIMLPWLHTFFATQRYHPVVSPKGPRKGFSFRRKKYQEQTWEEKM